MQMKIFGGWRKPEPNDKPEGPTFDTNATPTTNEIGDGSEIGHGRKILIVDDNKVVLKAFELKLQALGFEVLTATDGSAAVNIARQDKPDLMVLDINFPPDVGSTGLQWDGFNIMDWMGRFKEAAGIPVIIITSGDAEKYKDRALEAGAVAFFQKPINHEEFITTIRRILGNKKSSNPAAA